LEKKLVSFQENEVGRWLRLGNETTKRLKLVSGKYLNAVDLTFDAAKEFLNLI
jgi:hypothetical protein